MRLIDADKLKEKVFSYNFKNLIDDQPTVDIVQCKDCKYWEVDNDVGFCKRTEDCDWTADDFCSRGVKK